jgi:hypothetical protein
MASAEISVNVRNNGESYQYGVYLKRKRDKQWRRDITVAMRSVSAQWLAANAG